MDQLAENAPPGPCMGVRSRINCSGGYQPMDLIPVDSVRAGKAQCSPGEASELRSVGPQARRSCGCRQMNDGTHVRLPGKFGTRARRDMKMREAVHPPWGAPSCWRWWSRRGCPSGGSELLVVLTTLATASMSFPVRTLFVSWNFSISSSTAWRAEYTSGLASGRVFWTCYRPRSRDCRTCRRSPLSRTGRTPQCRWGACRQAPSARCGACR